MMIRTAATLIFFLLFPVFGHAQSVSRIDPPHWWAGFELQQVQLMVYGEDIDACEPSIREGNISLDAVTQVDNPNYLFIDLTISSRAVTGPRPIRFECEGDVTFSHDWELKERETDSAKRDGFNSSDTVYLLYPDRFANGDPANDTVDGYTEGLDRSDNYGRHGGDLQGVMDHLDYIEAMGFTQIWLNPVQENAMEQTSYHGYAITDLYQVDQRLGSNAQYRELADQARLRGIGVIQDVIPNHIGSGHYLWTDPPEDDWATFHGDYRPTNHQHVTVTDPYASAHDLKYFTQGWFWTGMIDLNQRNERVSNYLIQNYIWWIEEIGLSGLRVDTWGYSHGSFLNQMRERILAEYPNLNIVGEQWAETPAIIAPAQTGSPLNDGSIPHVPSLMDFPFRLTLIDALTEDDGWSSGWGKLYQFMVNDRLYGDPSDLMVFADNHDVNRIHTDLGEDIALTKMAMAIILTTRGIPQIHYGTELLYTNETDGDHGEIRREFLGGWSDHEASGFTGDGLDPEVAEFQSWLSTLLIWRQTASAVHAGDFMHFAPVNDHDARFDRESLYVYVRSNDEQTVLVALNKSDEARELDLSRYQQALGAVTYARDVLTGEQFSLRLGLTVPARSVRIVELN